MIAQKQIIFLKLSVFILFKYLLLNGHVFIVLYLILRMQLLTFYDNCTYRFAVNSLNGNACYLIFLSPCFIEENIIVLSTFPSNIMRTIYCLLQNILSLQIQANKLRVSITVRRDQPRNRPRLPPTLLIRSLIPKLTRCCQITWYILHCTMSEILIVYAQDVVGKLFCV